MWLQLFGGGRGGVGWGGVMCVMCVMCVGGRKKEMHVQVRDGEKGPTEMREMFDSKVQEVVDKAGGLRGMQGVQSHPKEEKKGKRGEPTC